MYNMNKTQLLCLVVSLVIASIILFVFAGLNSQKAAIVIESGHLKSIYQRWVSSGKPDQFAVINNFYSNTSSYTKDTNKYNFSNSVINGLFMSTSDRFANAGYIIITDKGQLFWVDNEKRLTPLQK